AFGQQGLADRKPRFLTPQPFRSNASLPGVRPPPANSGTSTSSRGTLPHHESPQSAGSSTNTVQSISDFRKVCTDSADNGVSISSGSRSSFTSSSAGTAASSRSLSLSIRLVSLGNDFNVAAELEVSRFPDRSSPRTRSP